MVKKLKPCPKCMGTLVALQTDKAHEGLWQGACMKCGKIGPWCKSQLEAIDAWNTLYFDGNFDAICFHG